MKKIAILFGLTFCTAQIFAQDTQVIYSDKKEQRPVKTLIKNEKGFGGHLSLNVAGTQIYNDPALLVGGELAFTISHALNIGFAGYGMPTRINYRDNDGVYPGSQYIELGYGGLLIEPVFFDQQVVHFTVPVLIGAGWVGLSNWKQLQVPYDPYPMYITDQSAFFVFQPGINMEVNLARNVKLTLGGAYRFVNGSDVQQLSDADLSGYTISGGVRVGWF